MKISQKAVSIIFLCLMTIVLLAVLAFYYFSLDSMVKQISFVQPLNLSFDESKDSEATKLFLSHDVLTVKLFCNMNEKWPSSFYQLASDKCIADSSDYMFESKLLENEFNFNKIALVNEELDYRLFLDNKMAIFSDIVTRYKKHNSYMTDIVELGEGRDYRLNYFTLQSVFDRKNPEVVYILLSLNFQANWANGEHKNEMPDLPAYSGELVLYKYDLANDKFDILYNAYDIEAVKSIWKVGDAVVNDFNYVAIEKTEDKVYAPAHLLAIDDENNLLVAGSSYYGMTGLGGGEIDFTFEGLSGWTDLYLLKSGAKSLTEFKYTELDNYYNADLYDFFFSKYYPKYIDTDSEFSNVRWSDYEKF